MGYEEEILERAERLGALASGVSGNGPSLFAITKEGDEGPIVEEFSKHGEVRVVELVSHGGLSRTFKG
jgi:shikimate kinase